MKIKYLVWSCIILTFSSFIMQNAMSYGQPQSFSGNVLFMKTNSIAHLTVRYVIQSSSNDNNAISTEIQLHDSNLQNPNSLASDDLTIHAVPNSIPQNTGNNTVTYTIVAQNNITGIYGIPLSLSCGFSPLVVGLNESDIHPSILVRFFTAVYNCPAMSYSAKMTIIGYDGIVSKEVTISQAQLSPYAQFQTGFVNEKNIQCKQGFMVILKSEDLSAVCVTPSTSKILVERGWAKSLQ